MYTCFAHVHVRVHVQVTYRTFHREVPDKDIVGSCSFRPQAPVQSVGDVRSAAEEV